MTKVNSLQQVPDELERVMVGVQSYLSIRSRAHDAGLAIFELEEDKMLERKVYYLLLSSSCHLFALM